MQRVYSVIAGLGEVALFAGAAAVLIAAASFVL